MKIVQEVRGDAPTQDAYTGEPGQLTVDTDNNDLRLHDGSTQGGHRLLNRDNGDERWQGKSAELAGLQFNPEQRGFVVRLTTGNYRIRALTVNDQNLQITYADGYDGNPLIELMPTIESVHTFDNGLTVKNGLAFPDGATGSLTGNTTGTHTGDVVGNVTGNLTGDANGNHTGSFTGDVDVSAGSILFANDQIPTSAINGLLAYIKANAEEVGMIKMWGGSAESIPAGWVLCNGLNGTPDLTGCFILGAGSISVDPGDTGGSATHTHSSTMDSAGAHTHALTIDGHTLTESEIPSHKHANGVTDTGAGDVFSRGTTSSPGSPDSIDNNGSDGTLEGWTSDVGGGDPHSHTGSSASAGSHSHALNNASASSMPPYYALCIIMRVNL